MRTTRESVPFLFSEDAEDRLVRAFEPEIYEAGDVVVWQGDYGDSYYAVESGAVEVVIDGHRIKGVSNYTTGSGFGELALAQGTLRAASCRAVARAKVWSLSRTAYRTALGDAAHADRSGRLTFLESVDLFKILSRHSLEKLSLIHI